jgi:hypothetical protein
MRQLKCSVKILGIMLPLLAIGMYSYAAGTNRLNPASLAFVTEDRVTVTNAITADIATDITEFNPEDRISLGGVDPYALMYQSEGLHHIYYVKDGQKVYTFDNGGTTFDVQLSDWGFDIEHHQVLDEVVSWYDNVQMTGMVHDHMNALSLIPSVSFIQKGFYASYKRSISAYGDPESTASLDNQYITVAQNEKLTIGVSSTDAHIMSFGLGGRYTRTTAKEFRVPRFEDYDSRECEDPDDITKGLVEGTLFKGVPIEHQFEMTLGSMAKAGGVTAGITSVLPVFPLESTTAAIETLIRELSVSFGIGSEVPDSSGIIFSAEAHVNRLASSTGREFLASSGISLHTSRHVRAEVAASYGQPVPGTYTELSSDGLTELFDPSIGTAVFGAGMQLLHARIDVALSLPALTAGAYISSWMNGTRLPGFFDFGGPVIRLSGSTVF